MAVNVLIVASAVVESYKDIVCFHSRLSWSRLHQVSPVLKAWLWTHWTGCCIMWRYSVCREVKTSLRSIWQYWREICTHYKCVMQHSYVSLFLLFFCIRNENFYTYTMGSCAILTWCLSLHYPLYFLVNYLSFYSPVYRKHYVSLHW